MLTLGIQWYIKPSDDLLTQLVEFLGESSVELEFE